jgi:hypothetical protein
MSSANLEKCLNSLTLSLDKLGFEYEVL